jgi:putative transposase
MSRVALPIKILARSKTLLIKELDKRQLPGHFKLRMQIVLASESKNNKDIAIELKCGLETVRRWRKRWYENQEDLEVLEVGHEEEPPATEGKLLKKIRAILSDSKRSGAPCIITESEVDRLIALACEPPEKYGHPVTHWTHELLSRQAVKMGIQVSASHAGKLIKKRFTSP